MNANEVVALFFPSQLGRGSYFIRGCATSLLVWGFIGGSGLDIESKCDGGDPGAPCFRLFHLLGGATENA